MATPQNLGQALVEIGLIDGEQLARLSASVRKNGRRLSEEIVAAGIVTEERLVAELAKYLDLDIVDPARTPIHKRVIGMVPPDVAHKYRVVPLARRKDGDVESLFVVTADPFDALASNAIESLVPEGVSVKCLLTGEREIQAALDEHYGPSPRPDTVSGPAPQASLDDPGGIRMGGSAAMPLSNSILPDGEMAEQPTEAAAGPPPLARKPSPRPASVPVNGADNQLGSYALLERIGVSGMAETWDATDTSGKVASDHVRVRRMLPALSKNERSRAKFFGAARRMVGVEHPNLVSVLDAGTQDGQDYVVTEPVDGHELDRVLAAASAKKIVVPPALAVLVMQGILRGLQAAHDAMVFHEHLSPRTVLIAKDGSVRVADFGVAPTLLEERGRYVAPEQAAGGDVDHRTDVFRAGLILFELLTSEPLVDASMKDPSRAAEAIRGYRKRLAEVHKNAGGPRSTIGSAAEKMLTSALNNQPDRRYDSAEVFLEEVERLLARAGTTSSDAALMRFVEDVFRADPRAAEGSAIEDAADAFSSAAAASSRALRSAAEEVAPVVKRAGERAAPVLERLGERGLDGFERLMAAPSGVKLAIAAGVFFTVVMLSAVVAVIMSSTREPEPETIAIRDEPAEIADAAERPTDRARKDALTTAVVRPSVEVYPGVQDGPPPPGHHYAASHGVELLATSEDDGEVVLWLEVGQLLRDMGDVEGRRLVFVPPRGPAGFVRPDTLTDTMPLEALARKIAFPGCQVQRSRTLDDCLYGAKQRHNGCLDKCEGRDGTRCKPTCDLAFERCLIGCRESDGVADRSRRRRRKRR